MIEELRDEQRLWRYMDLPKFALMLATQTVYFPSFEELASNDPSEGYLPASVAKPFQKVFDDFNQEKASEMRRLAAESLGEKAPTLDVAASALVLHMEARRLEQLTKGPFSFYRQPFGAWCWHRNKGQSDAMWRLYSALGAGVAIETTVGRLRAFMATVPEFEELEPVEYVEFETDVPSRLFAPLFTKRLSYEHEREVRATVRLRGESAVGFSHPCDLAALITGVHVSPSADKVFHSVVFELCSGKLNGMHFAVQRSPLYAVPDY